MVFTVRTYLQPLTDLAEDPVALENLWDSVLNLPAVTSKYKVTELWQEPFENYCKRVLGKERPEVSV